MANITVIMATRLLGTVVAAAIAVISERSKAIEKRSELCICNEDGTIGDGTNKL